MLLAVDIGNTNIAIGLFKDKRLRKKFYFPTVSSYSHRFFSEFKKNIDSLDLDISSIKAAVVCSVVPSASRHITEIFKNRFGIDCFLVGRDIKVPVKNLYKRPKQVGQDRLVNAYACLKYYGKPAIIVDFGTATTFDYLDSKGAYCGGLIAPGVEISLDALAKRTALLPKIELKEPKDLIGKDTIESMRSGVLYGLASMCEGVIEKIRKRYASKAIVVATGGLASFFAPYCRHIEHIDADLTLKGLNLIFNMIKL